MEHAQANLEVFAATLLELAGEDSDLSLVTSDSLGSARLAPFAKVAPRQIVEVGFAEQNLVGVAAGLAAAGKKVFAVSPIKVEEHSVNGDWSEACAGLLLQECIHSRFKFVGFPDEHTVTGSQMEIFRHYGIEGPWLATIAQQLLANH
jgi:transketolase C-terminal domain/subunit